MERGSVSRHEVGVYRVLMAATPGWLSSQEIADRTGIAPRTARAHASKLVRLGVVDQVEVFPGYRYRIAEHASQHSGEYVDRLRQAADVLDIHLERA